MGNLTTFTLRNATPESIVASSTEIVDFIDVSDMRGGVETIGAMELQVFPYVESRDDVVYVQHGQQLLDANRKIPKQVQQFLRDTYRVLRSGNMTPSLRKPSPACTSLDQALLVATVYGDQFHLLKSYPVDFGESLAHAAMHFLGQNRGQLGVLGQTILQKPLHVDANAVYICSGNETVWFDAASPHPQRLKHECPTFYVDLMRALNHSGKY